MALKTFDLFEIDNKQAFFIVQLSKILFINFMVLKTTAILAPEDKNQ
jgi:hypothetical protein